MRTVWQRIADRLGLSKSRRAPLRRERLQIEILEDRAVPADLLSVTPSAPIITDAQAPGIFELRLQFDETMSSTAPTVTFPNTSPGSSLSFIGFQLATTSIANDTIVARYNALDQNVQVGLINVQVSGAVTFNGSVVVPTETANNVFQINTLQPVVTSVVANFPVIRTVNNGQTFTITVTYKEAMDTNVLPAIVFSQSPGSVLTQVTPSTSDWTNSTTFVFKYTVNTNTVVTIAAIGVTITGARNLANQTQIPYQQDGVFGIDTRADTSGLFAPGSSKQLAGDFNGDNLTDIAVYYPNTGRWFVALSTGTGFLAPQLWFTFGTKTGYTRQLVADFNNDNRDDILSFYNVGSHAILWVSLSDGTKFTTTRWANYGTTITAAGWRFMVIGDFNGDSRDDVAAFLNRNSLARWYVSLSNGATAFTTTLWGNLANLTATGWTNAVVGDFNNDGRDDIGNFLNPTVATRWWVSISNLNNTFTTTHWTAGTPLPSQTTTWSNQLAGDFNKDGRIDLAAYNRTTGDWWVSLSTGTNFNSSVWLNLDETVSYVQVVGDFNKDGRSDLGIIGPPANGFRAVATGISNGVNAFGLALAEANLLANPMAVALAGDFNNDGRTDIAYFFSFGSAPMQWWVSLSTTSSTFNTTRWR